MKPLIDPDQLKPSEYEAHQRFDDDGNPWDPMTPEPDDTWRDYFEDKLAELRCQYIKATKAIDARPMVSLAIALGAGYVVGRILAARSS
jgi:hypothetical protein